MWRPHFFHNRGLLCGSVSLGRFDRLQLKLFLAIAGAIAGLTLVSYLVFTWTFERGFVQYVNRADDARLELMTDRLADVYAREDGWAALARDPDRWSAMSRDALGFRRRPTPASAASSRSRSTRACSCSTPTGRC